ncbi:glycosyltransferase family 2 protein [Clostridium perfringens]|uniref:glycosyltransferase family 2 protein n=1 Tax=Clostridium perfringens TaxID=1502 RepID=UPI001D7EEC3C|nr:glycosyltransferase family 2 protein [Clostridium perfringens]
MKISVIIPVYNAEKYIKKCLNSVIEQTYSDWEIIAVDDGSIDESYNVLLSYAKYDSRINVETKQNEGPGLTRNCALDKATGDIIVFLDADDYIEPNYFELLNDKVVNEKADVIFIDVIQESPDGTVLRYEKMSNFNSNCRKDILGYQMTGNMPWGGCRKAALRSLIEKESLRYTADVVGEEAIFSFELLRHAKKICFIEKCLYHYINHPNSQSKNPNGTWEITLKKMTNHLEKMNIRNEYDDCLNAFAFTVLILWVLRNSKVQSVGKCRKNLKEKISEFEKNYGWNIQPKYLRKELRILLPILKNRLLFLVVIAAKFVRRYK